MSDDKNASEGLAQPADMMEQRVCQRIRECAEQVSTIQQDDDDTKIAALVPGGEAVLFRAFINAIDEAGWKLIPKCEP